MLSAGNGQTLHVDFTPTDTTNYNTASNDVSINVLAKGTPAITWNNPADIIYGTALDGTQLNATASVAGTFVFTPAAGTVLNAGNGQTLHVDFTPSDATNYTSASKDVVINVLKATPSITWNNPADITSGTALSGTQLNATSPVAGSFVYTPASGTVLSGGNSQTLHVDFTPTDTANYNSASKDVVINVGRTTPSITWNNPADIAYGTALGGTQLNATAPVAGSFVYTPASGTVLDVGNGQTLHVDFTPTDTANYNSASKDVAINVVKATPTITWNSNPADIVYGTPLSGTQLNATSPVAGTFVYSPAAGTVLNAGNGQTLHVDFTPTDTAHYNSTSMEITINVLKAAPSITWNNPADITSGTALSGTQLDATASVAGSFVYTPAAGTVLSAGNNQTLHVDFTPTDTANYNSASKDVVINVVAKTTPTITWNNPADITYGAALDGTQLNATASVAGTFVYTPAAGTVLNAGNGQTLHVDFTPSDTATYNTASKDVVINVLKATPAITWNNPAGIAYGTALSGTQLNATGSVAGSMVYTPASGTVLNVGNAQTLHVDFTPSDTANYNSASKDVVINVVKATPSITWNNNPADIVYGTPLSGTQLNATSPVAGTFVYTPAAGTFLNAGNGQTLHVDFTPWDTANYNTASMDIVINVLKATPSITWNNPADITSGTALSGTQLDATASVAGSFIYTPASGTVLSAGNNQTLHVDFTPTDTANYNSASKDVLINIVAKTTPTITWNNPADITYGTALDGTQLNATASVAGTFVYTPAAGTVLNAGNGQTLHVDFTPTDTATYNTASKDVVINVLKATPAITWNNPADIAYGTALSGTQLNATGSVAGGMVYTPAAGTGLNVGNAQTLHVDFTPADAVNYNTASKDVVINVVKATPSITWNSNPADIVYGTPLSGTQLNATSPVAGTFVYTPASGTVLNAGNGQTLHVDFTPTDTANYNTASMDILINVLKATPSITWNNPADITSGTTLGGTQLNATASVAGGFVYTPAAGTVLGLGNGQTLHVDFTPTDTANYNTASKDVLINVTSKITPAITWNDPADITYGAALDGTQLNATASVAGTIA